MPNKRTILIVDHQPAARRTLARELTPLYDLLFAKDGVEAVRVFEQHPTKITTMLVDLHLPRLGGRAVTEWVHHILPDLPVVIMSKALDDDVEELLEHSETVTFVRKPFQLPELKKVLRNIVGKPSLTLAAGS